MRLDKKRARMTVTEIRQQLKRIASVAWSLSIELENTYQDGNRLLALYDGTKEELQAVEAELKRYKALERNRLNGRKMYAKRKEKRGASGFVTVSSDSSGDLGVLNGDETKRTYQPWREGDEGD